MELLVVLGLLTHEELESYLIITGQLKVGNHLSMDKDHSFKLDPLLSLELGDDGDILDLDVLGPDGLLNIDLGNKNLLNIGGHGPLIDLGGKGRGLLGLGGILRRHHDGHHGHDGHDGHHDADRLVDVQVGGKKDHHKAVIDVDVATHSRRTHRPLADVQVGGEENDNNAVIDVDILTHSKGNAHHHDDYYLSHYHPVCKKGFKAEYRDQAETAHAQDANHCLALCHAHGALLTLEAGVQVGDLANILLCAAIEFDNSAHSDNCRFFVAPEHESYVDDQLEERDNCYSFVRN